MNWDEYRSMDAMNASTLVAGCKSMLHLKRVIDEGNQAPTPAMKFGTLVHSMVLEPDDFNNRYVVLPDFKNHPDNVTDTGKPSTSKTKWVTNQVAEFARENAGKEFMSPADLERAKRVKDAVYSKPFARQLLETTHHEVTLTGELNGVACKSRLDMLSEPRMADLKTAATVESRLFGSSAASLNYGFKLAFHQLMAKQELGVFPEVFIVSVETAGDFDVAIYNATDYVEQERQTVMTMLHRYKACKVSGEWPGVDGGADWSTLDLPNWAMENEFDWESV